MNDFTTELMKILLEKKDLNDFFRISLENALNNILEIERTAFLGYEAYDLIGYNSGNSRNGYYTRKLKTEYGELNIKIPRDRNGLFNNQTIQNFNNSNNNLEDMIVLMYKHGITTREISDIIEKMYGHHYSAQTVSNITNNVVEELEVFKKRPIKKRYVVIYCDATFINLRRDRVSKEALHTIIGITEEGYKEVLDFAIYPTENRENYREMLQNLKARGLESVLLFVSDGLNGLKDALLEVLPQAKHQSCWLHISRNIGNKVRVIDKKEILKDLKVVYSKSSVGEALKELEKFIEKWDRKYPKIKNSLSNRDNLFTFLDFPEEIRNSIYTNNISESFNKQLKRYIKVKEQFPNEKSLEKYVYISLQKYNQKLGDRIHKGFSLVQYEIAEMFEKIELITNKVKTKETITDDLKIQVDNVA